MAMLHNGVASIFHAIAPENCSFRQVARIGAILLQYTRILCDVLSWTRRFKAIAQQDIVRIIVNKMIAIIVLRELVKYICLHICRDIYIKKKIYIKNLY